MRSLYALHPETVLALHDRGAVVYGRPVALSSDEAESRMLHEPFARVVVDQDLFRDADAQRSLRRIARARPEVAIAWLRPHGAIPGGLSLDNLVRELSGDASVTPGRQVVVVSLDDPLAAQRTALAVACHFSRTRPVRLIESDTTAPVLAQDLGIPPRLREFLSGGAGVPLAHWPHDLRAIAAPMEPSLLLDQGMEPFALQLEHARAAADVVVRAGGNLCDRGLLGALAHASHVVVSGHLPHDYAGWVEKLAPLARLSRAAERRLPRTPTRAARVGERIWKEVPVEDGN